MPGDPRAACQQHACRIYGLPTRAFTTDILMKVRFFRTTPNAQSTRTHRQAHTHVDAETHCTRTRTHANARQRWFPARAFDRADREIAKY
jgi:hypothetical protein